MGARLAPAGARRARRLAAPALLAAAAGLAATGALAPADPLPSWKDGPSKRALAEFVARVTKPGTDDFVPPAERIAVFDNDGTLWAEQPMYFQLAFAIDRVRALAPEHPEWEETEPFASVLEGDLGAALAGGEHAVLALVAATHAGLTADEFAAAAREWLASAEHPTLGRRYRELVYRPMLELLEHLRANGFETFIVSGGGTDFLRAFAEEAYGIPPEQVVGSTLAARYELRDGVPVIVKVGDVEFVDDGPGKPVGVHRAIGRRPILAFGNSDGDRELLEYTTVLNPHPSLGLLLHHTDAEREFAYDRDSKVGRLARALDEAPGRGWQVVDPRTEWAVVFPPE